MTSKCLFMLLILLFLGCNEVKEPAFESIFDGQTWQGWEGDKAFFRIENQAIVAGSLIDTIPKNQFLCTEKSYADFELQMKVKFTSKTNNAGIQFRTSRIPDHHEVIGYQADVGFLPERPIWGSLYDESRRKRFLLEPPAEKILAVLQPEDWNTYRIQCQGPRIKFWLNDSLVLEYEESDETVAAAGVICVQIHSGDPAEAWYKDIEIKEL